MKAVTEQWVTDFMPLPVTFETVEKRDKLSRFIQYCLNENAGVLALALCIECEQLDIFEALQTFCGIHTNLNNRHRHKRVRKGVVNFDFDKFKKAYEAQGMTQRKFSAVSNISRTSVAKLLREKSKRKTKSFVYMCEKALGMPKGSLIKGVNNE